MKIERSSKFKRSYKKLSQTEQENFKDKILIFAKNMFDPSLKTHKLQPHKKQYFAFSIEHDLRIVFRVENDYVIFIDIGSHDKVC